MIGPFLVVIGLLLLWVAIKGKSNELLVALNLDQVPVNINKNVSDTLNTMIFTPLQQAIQSAVSSIHLFGG